MASIILAHAINPVRQQSGVLGVVCLRANYSSDAPRQLKTTNLGEMKRGTGGRSSFNGVVATVFGCSGFVGKYVCNRLGKIGTQLILPYRGDESDVARLKLVGDLGQVLFTPFHLLDEDSIRKAIKYSNVVINLIGRDWETKNFKFKDVHVDGARRLARLCREAGVDKFIHFSALNATPDPEPFFKKNGSGFLKSKYYGELAVREEFPEAIVFRPSDIMGQEDRFLGYYAHFMRRQFNHGVPLWKKGEATIKQPVHVYDVAQAVVNAIKDPDSKGQTYQAVGPRRYQLGELVDYFHRCMRRDLDAWGYFRYDLKWDPSFLPKVYLNEAICMANNLGNLHIERVEREYVTDEVEKGVPTLEDLGVQLTLPEDIVPWELRPHRAHQYYEEDVGEFPTPAPPKHIDVN